MSIVSNQIVMLHDGGILYTSISVPEGGHTCGICGASAIIMYAPCREDRYTGFIDETVGSTICRGCWTNINSRRNT